MKHTSLIATHSLIVFGLSTVLLAAVMPSGNSADARSIAPNASTAASASSLQVPEAIVRDIKTGYFHRAASSLEPMMPPHAGDPDYQYRYAQALLGAGRTDEALTAIKSAVALAPKTTTVFDVGLYAAGIAVIVTAVLTAAWGPARRAARTPIRDLISGSGTQ